MTSNPLNPSNGDEEPKDPLAEMLQNLPGWYRDLGRMPGDLMTDWFDAHHRSATAD